MIKIGNYELAALTIISLSCCYMFFCVKSCAESDVQRMSYWDGVRYGRSIYGTPIKPED